MIYRSIEICAGAGGQALGLEQAGFSHLALVEIEEIACETLRQNRPKWNVIKGDVKKFSAVKYSGIDLLAGGVPCPPFSIAGKQLGKDDDRDLFPVALRLTKECNPKAVMLENVRGIFSSKFDDYRSSIIKRMALYGYKCFWRLIQADQYGVAQKRTRAILVALKKEYAASFEWPAGLSVSPPTVGQLLKSEMASNGWSGADEWSKKAAGIAPTIVGGSKKHGGPDLGPTRARAEWSKLGVDGLGIADAPPSAGFTGAPRLTVKMVSLLQGFPQDWEFAGKKTAAYRQVGNAFPPPVAKAVGEAIIRSINATEKTSLNNGAEEAISSGAA